VTIRPGLAKTGYSQHNEIGLDSFKNIITKTKPFHHTGTKTLYEKVGCLYQFSENVFSGFTLKIEGEPYLVQVKT